MLQKTQEVLEFIANDELFENNDIRIVGGTALSEPTAQPPNLNNFNF